jgi:hypothetical protein
MNIICVAVWRGCFDDSWLGRKLKMSSRGNKWES